MQHITSKLRSSSTKTMCTLALLQFQLASNGDRLRHCGQRHRPARPVDIQCRWRGASAHVTLLTARMVTDSSSQRRAHVQCTGAAEPRAAKNFARTPVQAVSFGASGATLGGC